MADHQEVPYSQTLPLPDESGAVPTSTEARAKRRIAALEDELQSMRQERRGKQRFVILRFRLCPSHGPLQKDDLLYFSRQGNSPHGCPLHQLRGPDRRK